MRKIFMLFIGFAVLSSCDPNDTDPEPVVITAPATYSFERNGQSSVSYGGQTDRIAMAQELIVAMKDVDNATTISLLEMFRNEDSSGGDANPFSDSNLNASTKSVKSKVANSKDFFSANTAEGTMIKESLEEFINNQVDVVFPNWETLASQGAAGQVADGSSTRYVNKFGLENNQMVNKTLIGALMLDQINNHYLGSAVQDEADNIANNDGDIVADGKNYTTMEHKWDEGFGYLYGGSADGANAIATVGSDDIFLNKYLGKVNSNSNFSSISQVIFDAFKLGRAAIVGKDYKLRDEQVVIIRENLSKVIAVQAVHYLQQGRIQIEAGNRTGAFHDLSEGAGFLASLRFTRMANSKEAYLSPAEINAFVIGTLQGSGAGFWDITPDFLNQASERIAGAFGFEVSQAI
ncbi:MAG: hypothetical protein ACI9K1_002244 [Arcticibacterium sp.]|jgi:hypothetical protein